MDLDYQDHSLRCDECKLSAADLNADTLELSTVRLVLLSLESYR